MYFFLHQIILSHIILMSFICSSLKVAQTCWLSTLMETCPMTCVKTTQHWTLSRQLWPTEVEYTVTVWWDVKTADLGVHQHRCQAIDQMLCFLEKGFQHVIEKSSAFIGNIGWNCWSVNFPVAQVKSIIWAWTLMTYYDFLWGKRLGLLIENVFFFFYLR